MANDRCEPLLSSESSYLVSHRVHAGGVHQLRAVLPGDDRNARSSSPTVSINVLSGIHKIQHVVIIMQENRSFDSYFGTYPGADGIPHGVCVPDPLNGGCVAPFHDSADENFGGPHGAANATADIDGGLMDGFVEPGRAGRQAAPPTIRAAAPARRTQASKCIDVMGYHDAREIPNYWTYAENFVLQDHMFESDRLVEPARAPLRGLGVVGLLHESARPVLVQGRAREPEPPTTGPGPNAPSDQTAHYAWTD